ncbi:hypothetical protein POPTR_009G026850v4 [Populus trichocarpa]|uniref:Uncharacterized protein n=1 Tax=Populus trichocarpa TaxID=3694 RepID=A0ACC0SG40_POPTR|nr:hypothetical protein BDE02_09G020500 [Populus trichocarpa]KAI9388206.1 hypothetical protein POPTR_009G026850v4 [Populus trichocarpa]
MLTKCSVIKSLKLASSPLQRQADPSDDMQPCELKGKELAFAAINALNMLATWHL